MGIGKSALTPLPPDYFTLTFRQPNEIWICQPPRTLLIFLRSLCLYIWPEFPLAERHCNSHRQGTPRNLRTSASSTIENNNVSPVQQGLANTVFRLPQNPFFGNAAHGQSLKQSEKIYRFLAFLFAQIYDMDYELVSNGHFVRGVEACTCIFRLTGDTQARANLSTDKKLRTGESLSSRREVTFKSCFVNSTPREIFECSTQCPLTAVALEGWNRIFFINIDKAHFTELKRDLAAVSASGLESYCCLNPQVNEDRNAQQTNCETNFVIEFSGHPWDSYKAQSDLSPRLIIHVFTCLSKHGYKFVRNVNFRGNLDTLFFKRNSPPCEVRNQDESSSCSKINVQVYLSFCHQDCIRVYNASPEFCIWIGQLIHQIWAQGVVYEKQVIVTKPYTCQDENKTEDSFEYTEIKLRGTPWCIAEWNKDGLFAAKFLITRLISVLNLVGWKCLAGLNIYSSPYDKCLLVFEKEINPDSDQTTVDLEVIQLKQNVDNFVKPVDCLIPVCITPYDMDQICILGGSEAFLCQLHQQFSNLFGGEKYLNEKTEKALKTLPSTQFIYKDWIQLKSSFIPEALHCSFFPDAVLPALLKPRDGNSVAQKEVALTSINDSDPENYLEYAINYRPWNGPEHWSQKTYKKTSNRRLKFFLKSQLPLSLLCWIHELVVFRSLSVNALKDSCIDEKDMIEPRSCNDAHSETLPKTSDLLLCADCSSMTRNSPPSWIYLVHDKTYNILNTSD